MFLVDPFHATDLSFYILRKHQKTRGIQFSGLQKKTSGMQWVITKIELQYRSHVFNDNLEHIWHMKVRDHSFSTYAKIYGKAKVTS